MRCGYKLQNEQKYITIDFDSLSVGKNDNDKSVIDNYAIWDSKTGLVQLYDTNGKAIFINYRGNSCAKIPPKATNITFQANTGSPSWSANLKDEVAGEKLQAMVVTGQFDYLYR